MDHGVFNISATNLCSKLISVKLELIINVNNRMTSIFLNRNSRRSAFAL